MDVFISNTFSTKESGSVKPAKFVDDYMAREDLGEVGEPLLDYHAHIDLESGVVEEAQVYDKLTTPIDDFLDLYLSDGIAFTNEKLSVNDEEVEEVANDIQAAYDNHHTLNRFVISFDNDALLKLNLINKTKSDEEFKNKVARKQFLNKADQLKLRLAIQKSMQTFLEEAGYQSPKMVGVLQMDTNHLHCHLAVIDENFSPKRLVKYNGKFEEKGSIKLSLLDNIRSNVLDNLIGMERINPISQNFGDIAERSEENKEIELDDRTFAVLHEDEIFSRLFLKVVNESIINDELKLNKGQEKELVSNKELIETLSKTIEFIGINKLTANHAHIFNKMLESNLQDLALGKIEDETIGNIFKTDDKELNYLQVEEWFVKKTLELYPGSKLESSLEESYVDAVDKEIISSNIHKEILEMAQEDERKEKGKSKTLDLEGHPTTKLKEHDALSRWRKMTSVVKREIVDNLQIKPYEKFLKQVHKGFSRFKPVDDSLQSYDEVAFLTPIVYRKSSHYAKDTLSDTPDKVSDKTNEKEVIDGLYWRMIHQNVPIILSNQLKLLRDTLNRAQRKLKDFTKERYERIFSTKKIDETALKQEVFERLYNKAYKIDIDSESLVSSDEIDFAKSYYESNNKKLLTESQTLELTDKLSTVAREFTALANVSGDPKVINFKKILESIKEDKLNADFLSDNTKTVLAAALVNDFFITLSINALENGDFEKRLTQLSIDVLGDELVSDFSESRHLLSSENNRNRLDSAKAQFDKRKGSSEDTNEKPRLANISPEIDL
ncbi:relaxase MobL [Lactococcus insecticola]|uniref:Uncharacterized protein n=1 Tax=Pseudolactococcus insecticola TaxID=2709158 RepID=A0A6A0BBP6_9LACT|nr:relaxase MobL [Lactococcus insecticola]GFH41257.1 hypothetical protein Hs20B_16550 [Lactococcus insecticola]